MARKKNENLTFLPETNGNPAILGKLRGTCADFINPTRNGRKYSEKLWKKVFADPITKEYFENGGIFGELGHPEDRAETDMEKIAICMPQPPVENKNGQLEATFDILNTPNGRILKTLVDYGYKIGISSRGTGDVYSDASGNEVVDEDTYDFQAFDVVILPAVKTARLSPVTESLNKKRTLQESLKEQFNKATEDEKKVMKETLEKLELDEGIESASIETEDQIIKIEVEDKDSKIEEISNLPLEGNYIDEVEVEDKEEFDETDAAEDFGVEEVVENLQKALKENHELKKQIELLQRNTSVSNAKENQLVEEVNKYKTATRELSKKAISAKKLEEELSQSQKKSQTQKEILNDLKESFNTSKEKLKEANKNLIRKDIEIKKLNSKINSLNESLIQLEEKQEDLKTNYSSKLQKAKDLVEHYKKVSKNTVDRYIEVQSKLFGLNKDEISSRLNENYTLKDVDRICEDLHNYKVSINKLPFNTNKKLKIAVKESTESLTRNSNFEDDFIDDSLLKLAKINTD